MLGLHVTDECLEEFFVCFSTLLRMLMNRWGGVLCQFDRNNHSVVLTHWHIGSVTMLNSVCPPILANVVDIQKEHL